MSSTKMARCRTGYDYGDTARWIHHRVTCKSCQCETPIKIDARNYTIYQETGVTHFPELSDNQRLTLSTGHCAQCRKDAYGKDRTHSTHQAGVSA